MDAALGWVRKEQPTMRNLNQILKAFLGGAAASTLIACEEVDPPKRAEKAMVTHVAPVVEEPAKKEPVLPAPVKAEPVKTVAKEEPVVDDDLKPSQLLESA